MRRIFQLLLLVAMSCQAALPQNRSINDLRRMFDYDQNAPLDVREVGVINRNGLRIHDITYASPKSGRVTACLVAPTGRGRFAGVVFGLFLFWWMILGFVLRLGVGQRPALSRKLFVTISFNQWLIYDEV